MLVVHLLLIFSNCPFPLQKMSSLEQKLRAHQIQPTAMRILILEYLLQQKTGIDLATLEQVFDRAERSTLFRTLKTFEQKGLIHAIHDGQSTKFALCKDDCSVNTHHDQHIHFTCTQCQQTSCISTPHLPQINLPQHYTLSELNIIAKGTCPDCQ